jgi:hypothetical protein
MRAIPYGYGVTKEGDEKIAHKRVPTNAPATTPPTSTQHGSQSEKGVESIYRGYPREQTR